MPEIPRFDILFDHGEPSPLADAALEPYSSLGFPRAPEGRPWIYSNFVQSLDGIVSLLGTNPSGAEIAQSAADRWLMDLLRAYADGVLIGMNTLRVEQRLRGPQSRGIVFQVVEPALLDLRHRLGKGRQRNIFVTTAKHLDLSRWKAFDGDVVDAVILTSPTGRARLALQEHSHVTVIATGADETIDFRAAFHKLRDDLGIQYLLCEGGPTLYGTLARADLVDEKFVTIAPVEVGQIVPPEQERLASENSVNPLLRPTVFGGLGLTKETMTRWTWISSRKCGDHEFNRYRRKRSP
jgi:5-amino-6-(5-phosphoribosylamino)uracil reductase